MPDRDASAGLIRRVEATGDPFAIGQALGRAAAEDIRSKSFATSEFQALSERWRGHAYLQRLEAAARAAYPGYVREIEGIADGAAQDFQSIFMWNCRGDLRLPDDISPEALLAAAGGCTSIMIPARQNGGNPALIAHNEDGAPELLGHCFWVSVTPDEGPAFESFMYPGMLPGHTFGVNAAGLVQAINNVRVHDLKPGVPRHVVCRAVLGSRDLDGALAILRRPDRASGFHHNLGEAASGRLVSVEAPASGCSVRPVETPGAHANHLVEDAFADVEQVITQSSRDRQRRADDMIQAVPPTDRAGAEAILFERKTPVYRANDAGDDYSQTLATAVFELHADRVDWRIHASPEQPDALFGTTNVELQA